MVKGTRPVHELRNELVDVLPAVTDFRLIDLKGLVVGEIEDRNRRDNLRELNEPWHAWRELRRRPWIELRYTRLKGQRGLWVPGRDGASVIHIDPDVYDAAPSGLAWWREAELLTHELTHEDRGIAYTNSTSRWMTEIEERTVRRITRDRMHSWRTQTAAPIVRRGTTVEILR